MSLYMTSDSSRITQYGTLSEYVSAGVNLCKMLEYHHQVDETVMYAKIDETYIYFADTYQAVFPVSRLRELHHNPFKQPGLEALHGKRRVAEVEQNPTDLVQIGRFVACHAIH